MSTYGTVLNASANEQADKKQQAQPDLIAKRPKEALGNNAGA